MGKKKNKNKQQKNQVPSPAAASSSGDTPKSPAPKQSPRPAPVENGVSSHQKPPKKKAPPPLPLGVDLGTAHARIAAGPVSGTPGPADATSVRILSNADGVRRTPTLVGEGGLVGEGARKALARDDPRAAADGVARTAGVFAPAKDGRRGSNLRVLLAELGGYAAAAGGAAGSHLGAVVAVGPERVDGVLRTACAAAFGSVLGYLRPAAAVCVAHGLAGEKTDWRECAVVDWGASGITATHFRRAGGCLELVGSWTHRELTPDAVTGALVGHCANMFKRRNGGLDVNDSPRSTMKLWMACEYAVGVLGVGGAATVEVDGLMEGLDLSVPVSRPRFEMLIGRILASAAEFVGASLLPNRFDVVLLSGALCKAPCVAASFRKILKGDGDDAPWPGRPDVPADEAVAVGCAVHASAVVAARVSGKVTAVASKDIEEGVAPISPVSLGFGTEGEDADAFIKMGDPLPAVVSGEALRGKGLEVVQLMEGGGRTVLATAQIPEEVGAKDGEKKASVRMELTAEGRLSISVDGGPLTIL